MPARVAGLVLVVALLGASPSPRAQETYGGAVVPGTNTPARSGPEAVQSRPQRGYEVLAPRDRGGRVPYNCLAWAKGHTDAWVEPKAGVATMADILADNGCTVVACATPPEATACAPPAELVWLAYHAPAGAAPLPPTTLPPDPWFVHAMRRAASGWTSKTGSNARLDGMTDPARHLALEYVPSGLVLRCACCPIAGGVTTTTTGGVVTTSTTLPPGPAVQLAYTLSEDFPAGAVVCLSRINGGFVASHAGGCAGDHLHALSGQILILRDGVLDGPFVDADPTGCGFGRIVTAPCPPAP